MSKNQRTLHTIFILVIVLIAAFLLIQWQHFLRSPLTQETVVIDLPHGASLKQVTRILVQKDVLKSPRWFELYVRLKGDAKRLQAGEYRVDAGIKPPRLLQKIVNGEVVLHFVTLVEGWTFKQIFATIEADPYIQHTLAGDSPATVMQQLGHAGENPEGRFYPDTYAFAKGSKDTIILNKAYQKMHDILQKAWAGRAEGLPYDKPYDALIIASMIQKETAIDKEKTEIAGVIIRRIKKGMRLQIDPTVIYGLGKSFEGKLTRADLRKKTPYNTYTNRGLPPTPICMPDAASVQAAVHPTPGDTLYYVSKGDGSHVFSVTLKQHDAAIKKYLLKASEEK